jgi:putative transposase
MPVRPQCFSSQWIRDNRCGSCGRFLRAIGHPAVNTATAFQVENYILNVKREHPSWGARKIRERLLRRFADIPMPAKSTVHAVLDRHGLVERRGRLRRRAQGTALSLGQRPNELWCTDYKGEFLLGNHQYCYPLTVTDHASRYLLTCEGLSSTRENYAFTVFERLFKERGLPAGIRSDNGLSHPRMRCST